MITVGLVGTGRIAGLFDSPGDGPSGRTHAQAIHGLPALRLVSATNPDRVSLRRFVRRWAVPTPYASLDAMLAHPLPQIVSVCSPDATHFDVVRRLLSAERPPEVIFVEKPLCMTTGELLHLREMAAARRCLVAVNHTRRFDCAHRSLVSSVKSGRFGAAIEGRMTYYGGWLHNGVHLLDFCIWLFGSRFAVRKPRLLPFGYRGDPCISAQLDYGRFAVSIEAVDERKYQLFEGEFRFSGGRVNYRDFGNRIELEKVRVNRLGERELVAAGTLQRGRAHSPLTTAYSALCRYVRTGDRTGLSGILLKDAAGVMENLFNVKDKARA